MGCRHAKDSELDIVCDLLTSEFYDDPVLKFAFTGSDRDERKKVMRGFFRIYVELAHKLGGVLLTENNTGTLVYFGPKLMEMTEEDNQFIDSQLRQACGADYLTALAFMNGLDHFHPREPAHYYIFLLAVLRSDRGGEQVAKLFRRLNGILDKEKMPCYAECTTFSTRTLVRRFGYCDAGNPLSIEGFPELLPVWREPQ
ncbi:N-acetyltransferase [Pantoea cypripedii]|uniref:N-acetyltransferase n=1 Tax=Pantoea cypripedii TaxID=55209 RepID=A0A6B9G4S2_PANCY|nr:N-acetyltransferase [Pantoea cypripedii]QGY31862.1 N-acetyltransferase [Pantoea cypripedii]